MKIKGAFFQQGHLWVSGLRFILRRSRPGSMPFHIGHQHHLRKRRSAVALDMGSNRWHARLLNRRAWAACRLYWATHHSERRAMYERGTHSQGVKS